jgi:hypothetical protein
VSYRSVKSVGLHRNAPHSISNSFLCSLTITQFYIHSRRRSRCGYEMQGRHCMCNLTLRRVLASISAAEKQYYIFLEYVCSHRYPAWNAHASYCHVTPTPSLQYFSTLSHKRYDFRGGKKKVTERKMCVLILSTAFVWNVSHSKNNWTRYDEICILVYMYSTRYCSQSLMKLEVSGHIFEKYWNVKFN